MGNMSVELRVAGGVARNGVAREDSRGIGQGPYEQEATRPSHEVYKKWPRMGQGRTRTLGSCTRRLTWA
jgi:hypothetical protein